MSMTADILTPNWGIDAADPTPIRSSSFEHGTALKVASSHLDGDAFGSPVGLGPGRDWARLIDLVQNAARHSRDLEARAQEQELRVQELLQRVREDIRRAAEQVRVAETRAREAQAQAEASIQSAEERMRAAEARASTAEEWLVRVQNAIMTGFADPAGKIGA